MCQQIKQGYTLCPHVFCDLYIINCLSSHSGGCCEYKRMGIPDWAWGDTRMIDKCHFCMLEELDERDRRRGMRKLDLDLEGDCTHQHDNDCYDNSNDHSNDKAASQEKK
jgi:hypothetical protein